MMQFIKRPSISYLQFNRKQWIKLYKSEKLTLTDAEITQLRKINNHLSIKEIEKIYLPLSYLINFNINSYFTSRKERKEISDNKQRNTPYIIGISGSVAVGKSTTANILQILLGRWIKHKIIEIVTTDGFLYSNKILKKKNLMKRKGFPETYDTCSLIDFVLKIKSGISHITIPIYSHVMHDIIPGENKVISNPDVLILEGLNIIQNDSNHNNHMNYISISNLIDFSIYVDAPELFIRKWYTNRFLKFFRNTFLNSESYFYNYSKLSKREIINIADQLWIKINKKNLQQNILPIREKSNLILGKNINHKVKKIQLCKYCLPKIHHFVSLT